MYPVIQNLEKWTSILSCFKILSPVGQVNTNLTHLYDVIIKLSEDLEATKREFNGTKQDLEATKRELGETKQDLDDTKRDLNDTKRDLNETKEQQLKYERG